MTTPSEPGRETPTLSELAKRIDAARNHIEGASVYAAALLSWSHADPWPALNLAVMERWSKAGLVRVKKLAWKEAKKRSKQ